ncbi:MAG: helix-turn-helix transcriptional regulator [Sulfurimonas denitrificans]|nr:helix-turn-helix transcriptional regulator [Sulfurimonas denitrificans]
MYLKEFREQTGLSQKEFAEKLELTQVTIARYETDKMNPTSAVIEKYIDVFAANPSYLFLGLEPKFLTFEDNNLTQENHEVLKDLNLLLSQDELNLELNSILINKVLDKFIHNKEESSTVEKLLKALKLEGHIPVRPFLFLYYIFRYIAENKAELENIESYKKYIVDLVSRYKVFTIKNNPAFTNKIKQEFEANIELNFTEKECKLLITHPEETIKKLESKMTPMIVLAHRKIDIKTLFPSFEK